MFALTCTSCGGSGVERRKRRFLCSYCGSTVVPRLLPGTLCCDSGHGGGGCNETAISLCRGCARPLCDRHNDPKRHCWLEPFDPRCLNLNWSAEDLSDWVRLNQPFHRFPLEGFNPFEWVKHDRRSLWAVGEVEMVLADVVRPAVEDLGGNIVESSFSFESVCSDCEAEALRIVRQVVDARKKIYRKVAYEARVEALLAEARQVLDYVEAFLPVPVSDNMPAPDEAEPPVSLTLSCPPEDWDRKGVQAKERIAALERLKARLGASV